MMTCEDNAGCGCQTSDDDDDDVGDDDSSVDQQPVAGVRRTRARSHS